MAKVYDVAAVIGEKRDGKPLWKTFGAVFETEKGLALKLDSTPIAKDFDGWFKLFEPTARNQPEPKPAPKPEPSAQPEGPFEDDIPFRSRHWQS